MSDLDGSGLKVESPCERSPCMQWEGQDLNAQLFSPNGPAQEVPVRPPYQFFSFPTPSYCKNACRLTQ